MSFESAATDFTHHLSTLTQSLICSTLVFHERGVLCIMSSFPTDPVDVGAPVSASRGDPEKDLRQYVAILYSTTELLLIVRRAQLALAEYGDRYYLPYL